MNKKIIAVAVAVMLICSAAGIGTMAWFTSAATSTGNQFTSGTLLLGSEAANGDDVIERFATLEFKDMQPGLPPVKVLETELENVGSLPFYLYRMTAANIVDNNGANSVDDRILDDVLMLKIFIGGEQVYYGKLSQLQEENGGFFDPIYNIQPDEQRMLKIEAELPAATGNVYQGLTMKCDLNIFAAQNEMPITGQPIGRRYDMGNTGIFSVVGYNTNSKVNFDWDWTPDDNLLLGSERYELRIKHETGDTTTGITEERISIFIFNEEVESTVGINKNQVSVDWGEDIIKIDRSAFPAAWDGFEIELTGGQNGRTPQTIGYQYFSLAE